MESSERFQYFYSAPLQKEVELIRKKYPDVEAVSGGCGRTEPVTLERLRQLDHRVESTGVILSVAMGLSGTAAMGVALVLALVCGWVLPGVLTGIAGLAMAVLSLPVHQAVVTLQRRKHASEIARLADELSK